MAECELDLAVAQLDRSSPVSLKSKRVVTSRWAWSTALRTSCRSTSETTSKVGIGQTLSSFPQSWVGARVAKGSRL